MNDHLSQRLRRLLAHPGSTARRIAKRLGFSARRRQSAVAPRTDGAAAIGGLASSSATPGALLVGHPYGVLGVGEYFRASVSAFAAAGIPFHIRNTYGWGEHLAEKHPHFPFWDKLTNCNPYRANVFHINANEMADARRHLGDGFFAGRYNIAGWHWELSHFPVAWNAAIENVDELWASSRFMQHTFAESFRVPVVWMPHPVDVRVAGGPADIDDLRIPGGRYLFLALLDFTSFVARKNPLGAVRAFREAFPRGSEEVGLLIKANGAAARPAAARTFLASPELSDPRIVVVNETLDRRHMLGLFRRCDCFVSLHRAEGFGRGIAEALLMGKPVIVTGYSGSQDFTNPQNACIVDYELVDVGPDEYPHAAGQRWAEPDLEQAAWYMRRLVSEPTWGATLAERGRSLVEAQHGIESVARRYRARLSKLRLL